MKVYRICDGDPVGFVGRPTGKKMEIYLLPRFKRMYVSHRKLKPLEDIYILRLPCRSRKLYRLLYKYHSKIEELKILRKRKEITFRQYINLMREYIRRLRIIEYNLNRKESVTKEVKLNSVIRLRVKRAIRSHKL